MSVAAGKVALRRVLAERLRTVTPDQATQASQQMRERLRASLHDLGPVALAAYAALPCEPDPGPLIDACLASGTTVYYPRHRAGGYQLFPVSSRAHLRPRRFGILEPPAGPVGEIPPPGQTLVWLVPGLAFDAAGHRLGRGAGYYDRLLASYPGLRLGLAYDWQVVTEVPVLAHDQIMDAVVTETRVIHCRPASFPRPLASRQV